MASLSPAVRAEVARQISLPHELIKMFPTPKEAEAAGYRRFGSYLPGKGAHWMGGVINTTGKLTDQEIKRPTSLIYDGTSREARLAGFMYVSKYKDGAEPPEGFAGPNDSWHSHPGMCRGFISKSGAVEYFSGERGVPLSTEICKSKGGKPENGRNTMAHLWIVPGFDSKLGVFSAFNPALRCRDGTYRLGDGLDGTNNLCRSS